MELRKAFSMTFFKFLLFDLIFIAFLTLAPVSKAQATTITFNDLQPVDAPLNNQYPAGIVNWGNNQWFLSGPWGSFTSNSISFQSSSMTTATVSFITPSVLNSVDAYNGGTGSSTVTLSCTGNSTVTQVLTTGQVATINTNWATACTAITISASNGWWTNFDNFVYGGTGGTTPTPTSTPLPSTTPSPTTTPIPTPTATPGNGPLLGYHNIVTDGAGKILPWYSSNLGASYDHIISLVWNFWKNMPNESNGIPKYLQNRILEDNGPIGGDQLAMALSSWQLLYQYSGDQSVIDNMNVMANFYLDYGLSSSSSAWPNIPYPANSGGLEPVGPGFFFADFMLGADITQPDKAGSFGAELMTLYKMTGNLRYKNAAINIADTLASKTASGSANISPLPYRVNAITNQVIDTYTTNWTGTLRLFDDLITLNEGNVASYTNAHEKISTWLKTYPLVNHVWGPFFEDISDYSDTEINGDTLALYVLEHPTWDSNWQADVRSILDSTATQFGNSNWDGINWTNYGVLPIDEQTVYRVPGNSHTSRHYSVEIMYAEKTGDTTRKADAFRGLNWATYMVDNQGRNKYPWDGSWLTDGYGDYVRHYLRAMAAAPEIAPDSQDHLLRSSSVVKSISYATSQIIYTTFDMDSTEKLKLNFTPTYVAVDGDVLTTQTDPNIEGWSYEPTTKILILHHTHGTNVVIAATVPTPTPTVVPTITPTPTVVPTATPTPTIVPTPTPTVVPTPTPTPTITPTPTPSPGSTITFNDLSSPDRVLNGQYPTIVINWGTNQWYLSSAWGSFTTNSISFNTNVTNKTFSFVTAKKLVSVQAYNGGTGSTTVSFACSGNTTKTQSVAAGQTATILTGFMTACTTVTVGSTNGWWTNFDNFIIQ